MFKFGVVASFLLVATTVFGQSSDNSITSPVGGTLTAGTNVNVQWTPTTQGTVNLDLGDGPSGDIVIVENIATGIGNTGSFTWSIPDSIPRGSDYTIKISWNGGAGYNFSPRFTIDSTVAPSSNTTTTSSTSTSTTSSTTSGSTTASASGSASASGLASASASGSAAASTVKTVTRATATGATASPPSVSSKATRFAASTFGGIFILLAALALGMVVVV